MSKIENSENKKRNKKKKNNSWKDDLEKEIKKTMNFIVKNVK
jgi:hypothetical protein